MSDSEIHDGVGPYKALMFCPHCGMQHVDRGEWSTRLHHKHLCESCGRLWRVEPYCVGVATAGVEASASDATSELQATLRREANLCRRREIPFQDQAPIWRALSTAFESMARNLEREKPKESALQLASIELFKRSFALTRLIEFNVARYQIAHNNGGGAPVIPCVPPCLRCALDNFKSAADAAETEVLRGATLQGPPVKRDS